MMIWDGSLCLSESFRSNQKANFQQFTCGAQLSIINVSPHSLAHLYKNQHVSPEFLVWQSSYLIFLKGEEFITCTATHHQGAVEIFWLHKP